jgi:DNA-binding MurR/RpiR family transcriptional regulator
MAFRRGFDGYSIFRLELEQEKRQTTTADSGHCQSIPEILEMYYILKGRITPRTNA